MLWTFPQGRVTEPGFIFEAAPEVFGSKFSQTSVSFLNQQYARETKSVRPTACHSSVCCCRGLHHLGDVSDVMLLEHSLDVVHDALVLLDTLEQWRRILACTHQHRLASRVVGVIFGHVVHLKHVIGSITPLSPLKFTRVGQSSKHGRDRNKALVTKHSLQCWKQRKEQTKHPTNQIFVSDGITLRQHPYSRFGSPNSNGDHTKKCNLLDTRLSGLDQRQKSVDTNRSKS